jgi:hypothetical protein
MQKKIAKAGPMAMGHMMLEFEDETKHRWGIVATIR